MFLRSKDLWLFMFQTNFVNHVFILYMDHEAIYTVIYMDMILHFV